MNRFKNFSLIEKQALKAAFEAGYNDGVADCLRNLQESDYNPDFGFSDWFEETYGKEDN